MGEKIEEFIFADGTTLSSITPDWLRYHPSYAANYPNDNRDKLAGTSGDDTIYAPDLGDAVYVYGGAGNDVLIGSDTGNDYLSGDAGNDILKVGGNIHGGSQLIYGGAGSDTYHIQANSGAVVMTYAGEGHSTTDVDRIIFDDITMNDLTDVRSITHEAGNPYGTEIVIEWTVDGQSGSLKLDNMGEKIEEFIFADGTVVDDFRIGTSSFAHVYGGAGRDVYDLGGNNSSSFEHAVGSAGDDNYIVREGYGKSVVSGETAGGNDRIIFADYGLADLTVTRYADPEQSDSLIFQDGNGFDLHVKGSVGSDNGIEAFEFADGTAFDAIQAGTAGLANQIGGAGDDLIDTAGNTSTSFEYAIGGAGSDTYVIRSGYGNVAISGETGEDNDRVVFLDHNFDDLSIMQHSAERPDSLIISDGNGLNLHISGADYTDNGIEQFIFADGTVMTSDEFLF